MQDEVVSKEEGEQRVKAYLKKMNSEIRSCAVCGHKNFISESKFCEVHIRNLKMFIVPNSKLEAYLRLDITHRSVFNITKIGNKYFYLIEKFINANYATLCGNCYRVYQLGNLPRYSIANGYDFGKIDKDIFKPLTLAEQLLISKHIVYSHVVKLCPENNSSQLGLKGHTIVFEHDGVSKICDKLPRIKDIHNHISVVFIGTTQKWEHQKKYIIDNKTMLSVRPDVIYKWLYMLKMVNPYYENIEIDNSFETMLNLSKLVQNFCINASIYDNKNAMRIEKMSKSNVTKNRDTPADTNSVESVFIYNNESEMKGHSYIKSVIDSLSDVTKVTITSTPLNEFEENHRIIQEGFPFLFPIKIPFAERGTLSNALVSTILTYWDNRFGKSSTFLFLLFDQKRRHHNIQNVTKRVSGSTTDVKELQDLLNNPSFETIIKRAKYYVQTISNIEDFEKKVQQDRELKDCLNTITKSMQVIGNDSPLSPMEQKASVARLRSLSTFYGLPTWFLTIAPSDIDSTIALRLNSKCSKEQFNIKLPNLSYSKRVRKILNNPVATARVYKLIIKYMFHKLIRCLDSTNIRSYTDKLKKGILATIIAWFLVHEMQGRGSLHMHAVLYGFISPTLLQRFASTEFHEAICDIINSVICADVPIEHMRTYEYMKQNKLSYRGASKEWDLCRWNYSEFIEHSWKSYLFNNNHRHCGTCMKGKSGRYGCRMAMPQPMLESTECVELHLDPNNDIRSSAVSTLPEILLRHHNPFHEHDNRTLYWQIKRSKNFDTKIVETSPLLAGALGSNSCCSLLGSTVQAKTACFYLTKYMTKSKTDLTNSVSAIFGAIEKRKLYSSTAPDNGEQSRETKYFLQMVLNSMSSSCEISSSMAAANLLGMKGWASSNQFWYIYIWPAIDFVKNILSGVTDSDNSEDESIESNEEDIYGGIRDKICPHSLYISDDRIDFVPQHIHYAYRGEHLAMFDFYSYVCCISIVKKVAPSTNRFSCGRKSNKTFAFDNRHPLFLTHVQKVRSKFVIPIISGRKCPMFTKGVVNGNPINRKNNNASMFLLTLLTPWCTSKCTPMFGVDYKCLVDLKNRYENDKIWNFRFSIMNNIINIPKINTRDKKTITKWRHREAEKWKSSPEEQRINNGLSIDENSNTIILQQIVQTVNNHNDVGYDAQLMMKFIELLNSVNNVFNVPPVVGNTSRITTSLNCNSEDYNLIFKSIVRYNETNEDIIADPSGRANNEFTDNISIEINNPLLPIVSSEILDEKQNDLLKKVISFCNKRIINQQFNSNIFKDSKLHLFIHGTAGTGKSTWSGEVFRSCGKYMINAAFQGSAACILNKGQTLHSLLNLSVNTKKDRDLTGKPLHQLKQNFKDKYIIFIDEVSHIDWELLSRVEKRLKQILGNTKPFGGIGVILCGDFQQIRPVGGTPLFCPIPKTCLTDDHMKLFEVHFFLKQYRIVDTNYYSYIQRFRNKYTRYPIDNMFVTFLNSKIISKSDIENNKDWLKVPCLVTNNRLRFEINFRRMKLFAQYHNKPILRWKKLMNKLSDAESDIVYSSTSSFTYYVEGAPVYISRNINVDVGIINGSWGYLSSLVLNSYDKGVIENESLSPAQIFTLNEAPNFILIKDLKNNLGENYFENTNMCFPLKGDFLNESKCFINDKVLKMKSSSYELGFSVTYNKVQGMTVDKIILDLNVYKKSKLTIDKVIVGLTRIRHSDGLRILKPLNGLNHLLKLKSDKRFFDWREKVQ